MDGGFNCFITEVAAGLEFEAKNAGNKRYFYILLQNLPDAIEVRFVTPVAFGGASEPRAKISFNDKKFIIR